MASPTRSTASIRHALLDAFHKIGGVEALAEWARQPKNRGAFYTICARLVPSETISTGPSNVVVMVGVGREAIGPDPWENLRPAEPKRQHPLDRHSCPPTDEP